MKLFEIIHKKTGDKLVPVGYGGYKWHKNKHNYFHEDQLVDLLKHLSSSMSDARDAFEFGYIKYYNVSVLDVYDESVIEFHAGHKGKKLFNRLKSKNGVELLSLIRKFSQYKISIQRAMLKYIVGLRSEKGLDEVEQK